MISAQGGDPDAPLPAARGAARRVAPADGVLVRLDALAVGVAAWRLGAGRARKEDPVSAEAGVIMHAKPGEPFTPEIRCSNCTRMMRGRFERALTAIESAYTIGVDFATAALDHRTDRR